MHSLAPALTLILSLTHSHDNKLLRTTTLMLLLIARIKFSDFSDFSDQHHYR